MKLGAPRFGVYMFRVVKSFWWIFTLVKYEVTFLSGLANFGLKFMWLVYIVNWTIYNLCEVLSRLDCSVCIYVGNYLNYVNYVGGASHY